MKLINRLHGGVKVGIGLYIFGKPKAKGLFMQRPAREKVFKDLEAFFKSQEDEILKLLTNIKYGDSKLLVTLYPSEEPIEFTYTEQKVLICSARTNGGGPGYHNYLVNLLENCEKQTGITWVWNDGEEACDETGYNEHRNYNKLQDEMLIWLKSIAKILVEKEDVYSRFCLNIPTNFMVEEDYFAISPMGYWKKEWFQKVNSLSNDHIKEFGCKFFPWWNIEKDAQFYLNTAIVLMWMNCPWHIPNSEEEAALYKLIINCLEKAYAMDMTLDFPWKEWEQLLKLIGENDKADKLRQISLYESTNEEIGFLRKKMQRSINQNWKLTIPGYFYNDIEDDNSLIYWFDDKTIRISTINVQGKNNITPSASELFKSLDVNKSSETEETIDQQNDDFPRRATVQKAIEKDKEFWILRGYATIDGEILIVSFCYENAADKDWALGVWKTLKAV